jgi:methionyl-tRNA formyltransferase
MDATVDTGRVVMVRRFPILPTDDIASLLFRTHQHLLGLFYDILSLVAEGAELPACDERWTRRPFTREELDALARIDPAMELAEVQRRIRATAFGSWRPFVELHGHRWELAP